MSEVAIAVKKIFIFLIFFVLAYFLAYFILVNDHEVTIYLNPIFHAVGSNIKLQVWVFLIASMIFGVVLTSVISWLYVSKHEKHIQNLAKENAALKNRLNRVKEDITKCVA